MKYQNLGEFLKRNSEKYKDRVAYEIKRGLRTQRFTFDRVHSLARKTATFLQQKDLKKGDKVAIWAGNCPEYPILYFGCWILGVVTVPIDVRTTQETLKNFLEKARCQLGFKGKFVPGDFGKLVKESFYLEDLTGLVSDLSSNIALPSINSNDLAEIAFTSGTTGTPKGVILTHGNLLSDVDALTAAFPFKKDWRALSLLPLSHAFEQVVDFLAPYQTGIKITYLERINALTILRAFRKSKISSVALVPQVLRLLLNGIEREVERQKKTKQFQMALKIAQCLPIFLRRALFSEIHKNLGGNLKFFGSGSAPLDLKLAKYWENLGIEIFEGYGATETTAALTINTSFDKRLGSVGKVLPRMQVRIDPKTSEIEARGPNISPGYFEDLEKTKAAFRNFWYRTGDIGQFDHDGFLYITGREAFRIVLPNGQKVYPEDLEKKLNAHPEVLEACVIGVKRKEGEVVHASIITKYPQKLRSIISTVNKNLSSHEQIMEWSEWKGEDFPRTPILKVDRRKVLEVIQGTVSEAPRPDVKTEDKLINFISQVTKFPPQKIKESSTLAQDLKLDSLGRVEFLSLIEQEFAVAIPETSINAQATVEDVRKMIKESPPVAEEIQINPFLYSWLMSKIRVALQNILVFPLYSLFAPLRILGRENLQNLRFPAIFYFNHVGNMDGLSVLRVLPDKIREKLVIAVDAEVFKTYKKPFVEIFGGAFPFDKYKMIKASLELAGEFFDQGYSVLVAPEGDVSKTGELMAFRPGTGLLAVEMQVPVVPIKVDSRHREIFPPDAKTFWDNFPRKRKQITLSIGKPITFTKGVSYEDATMKMRDVLEDL